MAISTTGSFLVANSTSVSTIAVTVATAGDLCVMFVANISSSITPATMSGTNSMGAFDSTAAISDAGIGASGRLFWAKAGASGSSTLTVTFSGTIGANGRQFDGWMFTAGLGANTVWTVDDLGTRLTTSSTTVLYPSLQAGGTGELYAGCAVVQATGSAGATSGFTYNADTNFTNVFARNTNASGTLSPTAVDSFAGNACACAALFTAALPSNPPFISQYSSYH